ncbi:MAG: hypothetical protein H6828_02365 [Planctomycetes bacterium]|nr:hypothetical protein [Planctomycetota bacterium]
MPSLLSFVRPRAALAALVALAAAAPASAQAGRIPVNVVDGRLVLRCDVSTRFRRLPVNLFLDYEATCGLELHNQAAAGLKSETEDGRSFPITVHLPGLDLEVERREIGDDQYLNEFTRWNSIALGEVSVVGTIGAKLLKDYYVVLDLDAGFVELQPARAREEQAPAAPEGFQRVPITEVNDIVFLPVTYDGGRAGAMVLGTSTFDTRVDGFLADDLGAPAGDIGPVTLAGHDLTQFVALRPSELNYSHPDGALGATGLNLLECFRVEVDRVNRCAYLQQMRPAELPEGDQEYFRAMVDEDAQGLRDFLAAHAGHRLALEAARLLVTLGLIDGTPAEELRPAIEAVDHACPEDLRATSALAQMKVCSAFGLPEHVILTGEVGLAGARDDRYPDAVHQIHARLGEVQLELGNEQEAWRHLLAAAFGLPEDGMVNLNLGRFYEQQGRWTRAFSRYLQAAIKADSGPQAVEGLARVAPHMPEDERYSVDVIERMIAGKVRNFGSATKFEATPENSGNRVVLVEFFTNAFVGDGSRGAIGGALANEGLQAHFSTGKVAFLSYHLPYEQLDPLIDELGTYTAAELNVPGPYVHSIDGVRQADGAGKWSDAEKIYNDVRKHVMDRLREPSDFEMELHGRVEDGVVKGELVVRGEARKKTLVQVVLAEKGVLFPGTTEVVVHRMLARGPLLGDVEGIDWEPVDGEMRIPFERSLADVRAENEAYLDELCAETEGIVRKLSLDIDPLQVRFVAHLRDARSGRVLQAALAEPENLAALEEGRP